MTEDTQESTTAPGPSASSAVPPPAGKADVGKRLVAVLIDAILTMIVGVIPIIGGLIGAVYMLVRDGLELEFMDRRSIGKKLMKLRPVRLDGGPMDIGASVKRNFPFAIGPAIMIIPILGWVIAPFIALTIGVIELVLVLTADDGRRLGDKFADTKVIEVSN
jgi:uncharacterized RDD family membrane protein YckC